MRRRRNNSGKPQSIRTRQQQNVDVRWWMIDVRSEGMVLRMLDIRFRYSCVGALLSSLEVLGRREVPLLQLATLFGERSLEREAAYVSRSSLPVVRSIRDEGPRSAGLLVKP